MIGKLGGTDNVLSAAGYPSGDLKDDAIGRVVIGGEGRRFGTTCSGCTFSCS